MKRIGWICKIILSVLLIVSLVIPVSAASGTDWLSSKEPVTDYSYSMAVVGDTQILLRWYIDKVDCIYDWIVENKSSKNIQYVLGLGDIVDGDTDKEWTEAYKEISKLNSVVPYSLIRGNHDSDAQFNNYFDGTYYEKTRHGSYDDSITNTYQTLTVGKVKYLIMALDYGPSDDVLDWAGGIIKKHSDHNVIVTTHGYLYTDGTHLNDDDADHIPHAPTKSGGVNNGDDIWNKLIRKHENIVLVLSGHVLNDDIVVSTATGDNGNKVTQMMINPQGIDSRTSTLGEGTGTGMVAMLYFSEDGSDVAVEYYSTVKQKYLREKNQFTLELATVKASSGTQQKPSGTTSSSTSSPSSTTSASSEESTTSTITYVTTTKPSSPSSDTSSKSDSSVSSGTTGTSSAPQSNTVTDGDDSSDGSFNYVPIIIGAGVLLLLIAGAVTFLIIRKKKAQEAEPPTT